MEASMKSIAFLTALVVLGSPALTAAQGDPSISSAEPYWDKIVLSEVNVTEGAETQ